MKHCSPHHWLLVLEGRVNHGTCQLCGARRDWVEQVLDIKWTIQPRGSLPELSRPIGKVSPGYWSWL